MRNFKVEDFDGSGQYLVRVCPDQEGQIKRGEEPYVSNTDFLATITVKVGYQYRGSRDLHTKYLISICDGLIYDGYKYKDEWLYWESDEEKKTSPIGASKKLVEYLNDPERCIQEKRFATKEEIIRIAIATNTNRYKD